MPWRSKTSRSNHQEPLPKNPEQSVLVDQMISPTPGLITQKSERSTHMRYTCATVYVDQATNYTFVYMQKTTSSNKTVGAWEGSI